MTVQLPDPPSDGICMNWNQHDNCDLQQPALPLPDFMEIRCAGGWCAPGEPEYTLMEVTS